MNNRRFIADCPSDRCTTEVGKKSGSPKGATDFETNDAIDIDKIEGAGDTNFKVITGQKLLLNQILATWMKLFIIWSRSWTMAILQILAPILLINFTLAMIVFATRRPATIEKRELVLTKGLDFQISSLFYIVKEP